VECERELEWVEGSMARNGMTIMMMMMMIIIIIF
jgi:hypothetical protein